MPYDIKRDDSVYIWEMESMDIFSEKSLLSLGDYYVYGLIDPRTNQIFYIGKGTGNRVFEHEKESLNSPSSDKLKLKTISEINALGLDVKKIIINSNLTETEAFAAEAALINAFNYVSGAGLTNIVAGHHSAEALSVEDFEKIYGAEELREEDVKHKILVIKINKLYRRDIHNVMQDTNRRNTQMLTDFIRGKKFAGDFRPIVTVEQVQLNEGTVDVIVVHNSTNTPYFLKEKYKGVFANNIYVRLQDSNTPSDKSADFHHIEYLWKKRFGMLLSPIEKVMLYLKHPEHWENSPSSEDKKYYKYAPEFTIDHTYEPEDGRDGYEYYLFAQTDSRPHWSEIRICYHQTVLAELGGVILDGGRYFTATPDRDGLSLTEYHNWDVSYRFMIKGKLNHLVHEFYYVDDGDEARHAHDEYEGCLLIFENEKEHQHFRNYVRKNWDRKEEFAKDIWLPYMEQLPGYNMDAFREEYRNMQILRKMLGEFRKNNTWS